MRALSSVRRWQLVSAALAAVVAYSWLHGPGEARSQPAAQRRAGLGPLRLSAGALGVSMADLVDRLLRSRDLVEMKSVTERLALVGDDSVVDAVRSLVDDRRTGVPDLVLNLIGRIGTEHAVSVLAELADDHRSDIVYGALSALGEAGGPRAEAVLITHAMRGETTAIDALGVIGTESAVTVLAQIAEEGAGDTPRAACRAMAAIHTPATAAAFHALINSPSLDTARMALEYLDEVDDATLPDVINLARSGEVMLARTAIGTLGHAGERAMPALGEIARTGSGDLRTAAISSLGTVGTPAAFEMLRELVDVDMPEVADAALTAIADFDSGEARDTLISIALSDRTIADNAVRHLASMNGSEVDQALMTIAQSTNEAGVTALATLLARDSEPALELARARATRGSDEERYEAMRVLSGATSDAAKLALVETVRASHGVLRSQALLLLDVAHVTDADATALLVDSLHASSPEERSAASRVLARMGTTAARDALVATLSSGDRDVVLEAVGALDGYRIDGPTEAALVAVARSQPALADDVMRRLVRSGSAAGMQLAEAAVQSSDSQRALLALNELGNVGGPAAFRILANAARASEEEVRTYALRGVAATGDANAVEVLASALRDPSAAVRDMVGDGLRRIGGERARAALMSMSRSSDAVDRQIAVQNLAGSRDPASQARIQELVRDPAPYVAEYAMRAMFSTDSIGPVSTLRGMVSDPSIPENIRITAANLLEQHQAGDEASRRVLEDAYQRD